MLSDEITFSAMINTTFFAPQKQLTHICRGTAVACALLPRNVVKLHIDSAKVSLPHLSLNPWLPLFALLTSFYERMYTVRTLDGTLQDTLDPAFRKINFNDEGAIVTVSTHLRALWKVLPQQPDGDKKPNPMTIARTHELKEDRSGYEGVESNPDLESLDTPWREELARNWNHVFYDVGRWLPAVSCSVGHFHPPNHEVFAIGFPNNSGNEAEDEGSRSLVFKKKWDRNILIIPAYLGKGVLLRVTILHDSQEEPPEKELGTLDSRNTAEIWYLRAGVEINVHVEGAYDPTEGGVAAVMVVGLLCTDSHGKANTCEAHGDESASEV